MQASSLSVRDLSQEQITKFSWWRCDQLYEKHESWGSWADDLRYYDFLDVGGKAVLLPHQPEDLEELFLEEYFISQDERVMTLFVRDYSWVEPGQTPTNDDLILSEGYVAVCYQPEGETFYVAAVYHSRYIVPGPVAGAPHWSSR